MAPASLSPRYPGALPLCSALLALLLAVPGLAQDEAAVSGLTVAEVACGTAVDRETRVLAGAAEEFPADVERVFCWTRLTGADAATQVTHAWYHAGEHMASVVLPVGSDDWRTYSSKAILPQWTGLWEVKVLDAQGTIIGSAAFTIR